MNAVRRRQLHLARHRQGARPLGNAPRVQGRRGGGAQRRRQGPESAATTPLDAYCVNPQQEGEERQDRPADRPRERGSTAPSRSCCRRSKNKPALCRRTPGVGKTRDRRGAGAPHRGSARFPRCCSTPRSSRSTWARLLRRHAPTAAISRRRLKAVLSELEAQPGAVLFIDEIHTVIGAGRQPSGRRRMGRLEPAEAGAPPAAAYAAIGSTTYKEYRKLLREGPGAGSPLPEDRRQRADGRGFGEDSCAASSPITSATTRVRYTPLTRIRAAVELSHRYINDRKLPDKAIDVIDESGAAQMLLPESRRRKDDHRQRRSSRSSRRWRASPRNRCRATTRRC